MLASESIITAAGEVVQNEVQVRSPAELDEALGGRCMECWERDVAIARWQVCSPCAVRLRRAAKAKGVGIIDVMSLMPHLPKEARVSLIKEFLDFKRNHRRAQWLKREHHLVEMAKRGESLAKIGVKFGITPERVRQILNKQGIRPVDFR